MLAFEQSRPFLDSSEAEFGEKTDMVGGKVLVRPSLHFTKILISGQGEPTQKAQIGAVLISRIKEDEVRTGHLDMMRGNRQRLKVDRSEFESMSQLVGKSRVEGVQKIEQIVLDFSLSVHHRMHECLTR
ncbi:hypothetical protein PENTCL1PPCAC_28834 [Pristionchus entomophagus]|uniref:Uncharacterized protein n=1 Tax=Pristionchus entomophagus TaxID=358040 RepID=A0AAV5UL38_9BILA|nr:hypothetical protein PENTCL1PPCAC_28834 [Pristionchus entomophagus]